MKQSTATILIGTALLLLMLPERALACSCFSSSPCEAFSGAASVFIGRMLSGTEKVEAKTTGDGSVSIEAGTVRFAVEETFKGTLGSEVEVLVSSNKGTSCGPYGLIRGERYLVYAYAHQGKLSTGVCTRTDLSSNAGEDMGFLRNLPKAGSGGRLYGGVWADKKEGGVTPLPGLTVVVRSEENEPIKVITNENGEFELANLKPGKYKVEPVWPEHFASDHPVSEVTISDQGCTRVGFEGKLNGRVTGRVFDSRNRPAKVMLHLQPVDAPDGMRGIIGFSNEAGSFEISGIPPGRYVLLLNLLSDGWKEKQQYFYPGVKNRAEATVIAIKLGEQVEGYNFQLPSEFVAQTIEGWVVWPDGTPAANVDVMLLCPKSPLSQGFNIEFGPPLARTDERGVFKLQGFKGHSYWIEARASKPRRAAGEETEVHSPPRQLLLKEDLINLKLILSGRGFSGECGEKEMKK